MEELNGLLQQKLDNLNKGFNFFNIVQTDKKFYIEVNLKVTQNLKSKDEVLDVKTNLDISNKGYWREYDVVEFLTDLENFCKKPFAKIITTNRKETLGWYGLSGIENVMRKKNLNFSDIKIVIGNLAKEKLKKLGIDFESQIENILSKQKDIDKKTQEKVNRYVFLREKIEVLKSINKENYGYSYYNRNIDNSLKINFTPEEYNRKLKEIETEIRKLEKFFGLSETDIKYLKIPEKIDYSKWLKENEESLREGFNEGEFEGTFEEYAELCFEQDSEDY